MSYAYYRWFPGDYQRDTMHLGWYEDLAYRRLIDLYNATGKPIRNDRSYIMRAIRATEPEQQSAADNVLSEFFQLKADGWHQVRCDAEIRYRRGIKETTKRAANARWNRNIDKELHADAMQTQSKSITNQNQNQNLRPDLEVSMSPTRVAANVKNSFKKIPLEPDPQTVERNRRIANAVAAGNLELAKKIRDESPA